MVVLAVLLPSVPGLAQELTLDRIMGNPDWISRAPENPYWSDDGRFVYYSRKREASELKDLFRVDAASGETTRGRGSRRRGGRRSGRRSGTRPGPRGSSSAAAIST